MSKVIKQHKARIEVLKEELSDILIEIAEINREVMEESECVYSVGAYLVLSENIDREDDTSAVMGALIGNGKQVVGGIANDDAIDEVLSEVVKRKLGSMIEDIL